MDAITQYGNILNRSYYQSMKPVDTEETRAQNLIPEQENKLRDSLDNLATQYQEPVRVDVGNRMSDLQDVSLAMKTQRDMEFLGRENGLETLDMEQAISDMRKDSVLQEYQYFVGGQAAVVTAGEDGIVVRK